jgi:hypothetical protein
MTPEEYDTGMRLVRSFHQMEKNIYDQVNWISHTNSARMKNFLRDLKDISVPNRHILPNYPPKNWLSTAKPGISQPVRAVYLGALSLDTMYTKEFAQWVLSQQGNIIWDIYSLNVTDEAASFIQALPGESVRLYPGISYREIPGVLKQYDLGLILYTGHIPNWIDNAPNKLFEYLSCGLDVWFPMDMKGCIPYITKDTYPKVVAVDFKQLAKLDLRIAMDRTAASYTIPEFFCEEVYRHLWEKLLEN